MPEVLIYNALALAKCAQSWYILSFNMSNYFRTHVVQGLLELYSLILVLKQVDIVVPSGDNSKLWRQLSERHFNVINRLVAF